MTLNMVFSVPFKRRIKKSQSSTQNQRSDHNISKMNGDNFEFLTIFSSK